MTTVKGNSGGDSNGNVKLQEWEGNSGGDSGNSAMARTLLQLQNNVVIIATQLGSDCENRTQLF